MNNLFHSLPDRLDQEALETILSCGSLKIERIISKGHRSPESGWYDQDQNEWVVVLKGSGRLQFENGDEIQLNPGDYINIDAHRKHRVIWTTPDTETIWLAVHY